MRFTHHLDLVVLLFLNADFVLKTGGLFLNADVFSVI